jgi:A/G-specific adenine glycosylase
VLRTETGPVDRAALDVVWADSTQRNRCLDSLLMDGLVEQTEDHRFALPGEA